MPGWLSKFRVPSARDQTHLDPTTPVIAPDLICIKATNLWFSQTARRGDACFGAANRARHSFDWDATW
ncbi:hypothetical protein, partial [Pseudotabrizicola sp.]